MERVGLSGVVVCDSEGRTEGVREVEMRGMLKRALRDIVGVVAASQ